MLPPQHGGRKGEGCAFTTRLALITAAASGIGRGTADIIAQDGGIVVAVDNHEERLDPTGAQLKQAGGRAHRRLCNAFDEKDLQATVGSIVREFGRVDILVNAAGGSTIIGKSGATVDEDQQVRFSLSCLRNSIPCWTASNSRVIIWPFLPQRRTGAVRSN